MKIFINYRRDDTREAAFIIAKSLMARFGESNVFFDRQGIQAGENFINSIEQAFTDCRIFIPLVGKEWNNILTQRIALEERDFVMEEITFAIDKKVIIIPLLIDDAEMPALNSLPEKLKAFSLINATDISTNHKHLLRDLEHLNEIVKNKLESIGIAMLKNGASIPDNSVKSIIQDPTLSATSLHEKNEGSWLKITTQGPGERSGFGLVYNETTSEVILHGGYGNGNLGDRPVSITSSIRSSHNLGDTWIWDGLSWHVLDIPPLPLSNFSMAYDKKNDRIIAFGGKHFGIRSNKTFLFVNNKWAEIQNESDSLPEAREDHMLIYDSKRESILLFGGTTIKTYGGQFAFGDTWEFKNTKWCKIHTPGPEPRWGHKMAFDKDSGNIILFGGFDGLNYFSDTWLWQGNYAEWQKVETIHSPPPRCYEGLIYDTKRRKVMMFGGLSLSQSCLNDLWEWNHNDWSLITEHAPPKSRHNPGFIYDEGRNKTLLFGGKNNSQDFQDTWELSF